MLPGDKFGLALTTEGGKTALVKLYAKSAFERDDWVRAFQAIKDEIEAKRNEHDGSHSPPQRIRTFYANNPPFRVSCLLELVRERAQSKAARYKETIEGRYNAPTAPESVPNERHANIDEPTRSPDLNLTLFLKIPYGVFAMGSTTACPHCSYSTNSGSIE